MGIPKLKSFVEWYFAGWQREELRGYLAVDGRNIAHHLNKVDWSYGGQFYEFRETVSSFYSGLRERGVDPIVVLDGIDHTGEKWDTIVKRQRKKIGDIRRCMSRGRRVDVMPALANNVYLQVLSDLRITFIVVDGEADDVLVKIANYYGCPVLSDDSDFFMYKLKGGYIPFNKLERSTPIMAEVYHYERFCETFFRDVSARLIIIALVGNDTLPPVVNNNKTYESYIVKRVELDRKEGWHDLLLVFRYAYLFHSLESFVRKISLQQRLTCDEQTQLKENCRRSRDIYDSDTTLKLDDIRTVTELSTWRGDHIPSWVVENYQNGQFSKFLFSVVVLRKYLLGIFVDDTDKESSALTSLLIRKCVYGIFECESVEEHFRVKDGHSTENVHSYDGDLPLPSLSDIPSLRLEARAAFLYSVLGCNKRVVQGLGSWKLVLATTVFWQKATQPPLHLVKSLLLCFLVCPLHLSRTYRSFRVFGSLSLNEAVKRNLHLFSQWQSCYNEAISLNQLLMHPLAMKCPSQIYDGKLVMSLAIKKPDIDALVQSDPDVDTNLYCSFLEVLSS